MKSRVLEEYLCGNPNIKPAIRARILDRFSSVQSILRQPDLLKQVVRQTELSEQIWRDLLDLRLDHAFDDEPPRFLGCSVIAQARWCHFKAVFQSITNEAGFKGAYDEDVLKQGPTPTVEDYNKFLRERSSPTRREKPVIILEGVETPRGRVSWDLEKARVVEEGFPDPWARGEVVEANRAEQYPRVRFHFQFLDKIILGVPDGITDAFCYEFKSTKNGFLYTFVLPVAKSQANLYAYFLKRPRIRVQIHILDADEVKTVEQEADYSQAEADLASFVELLSGQREPIAPKPWKCKHCECANKCGELRRRSSKGSHTGS